MFLKLNMSFMFGCPVTPYLLETCLDYIQDTLFVVDDCNGRAFGQFIRDVIVPRMEDSTCNVSFKRVGIWFKQEADAKQFISTMQIKYANLGLISSFNEAPLLPSDIMIQRYGVNGQWYTLYVHGTCVGWFDVIVSEEFPVNDFDVHCLSYSCRKDYSTGKQIITRELKSERGYQKEQLIKAIHNKQATLFEDYAKMAIKNNIYLDRINRFIRKGWTISFGKSQFTEPITEDKLTCQLININQVNSETTLPPVDEKECDSQINGDTIPYTKINLEITIPSSLNTILEFFIKDSGLIKEAISKMVCGAEDQK